ncbi:MAG: SDR family NAD(P)-dependent oxidoreductase [Syntrophobacter sp.]
MRAQCVKRAVIIGASSGIGRELARVLAEEGYTLGLVARRVHLLEDLAQSLPTQCFIHAIDVSALPEAMRLMEELLLEMGGADLVIIGAGTGFINPDLEWSKEKETIDVNVSGFAAIANVAFRHFSERGSGHLVSISSIAALRGSGQAPAYNASKAFISNYMQGLRQRSAKMGASIRITDIQPGLVDTAMAKGEGLFWVQPSSKVAKQIRAIIKSGRKHGYVTRRWRLIAWAVKAMPDFLYNRL